MTKLILDDNIKKQIIDDILKSSDFSRSKKYQKLLNYLTDATLKGETVKATSLAFEFFGKEASFDPSIDSTVRSYISNLRKKLEHYYFTEGEEDKYKIIIPKGNYNIEFEENTPIHSPHKQKYAHLIYLAIIALLLALSSFLIYKKYSQNHVRNISAFSNPIWGSFLESEKKTLFVIGNYFVFKLNINSGRKSYVRDIQINSADDLELFINENPNYKSKIEETSNSYLDESTPFCLASILPAFISKGVEFDIKLSSDLQLADLQNNNIIYIGSHKSLNILTLFTSNLNFKYNILPGGIKYYDTEKDTLFNYFIGDSLASLARRDFPIVVKQTGANNNSYLFFLSIHDIGNISTVKYFTNPKTAKEFNQKIGNNNFVALFESRGYRREDFSINLLHANKLPTKLEFPIK